MIFPHDLLASLLLDVFMIFHMTGISVLLDVFMIFPMFLWHFSTAGICFPMTLWHLSTAGMCFTHDPLASLYCWDVEDLSKYFVVDKVIQFLKCLLPLNIQILFEAVNYFSIGLVFIMRRIISVL